MKGFGRPSEVLLPRGSQVVHCLLCVSEASFLGVRIGLWTLLAPGGLSEYLYPLLRVSQTARCLNIPSRLKLSRGRLQKGHLSSSY